MENETGSLLDETPRLEPAIATELDADAVTVEQDRFAARGPAQLELDLGTGMGVRKIHAHAP